MAQLTFEVPESVLGEVYIAIGRVLERDAREARERNSSAGHQNAGWRDAGSDNAHDGEEA